MILVTGAGGKTGRAVMAALAARGAAVRALVHRAEHAFLVKALGARETCVGAFEDASALARTMEGVTAIYHICPNVSPHESTYARAVAAAASAAGVRRFVYHSVLHPQTEAMPHHWHKMRVEEMLFASGLDITILQPTAYMDNIGLREILGPGIHRIPYPVETRLSLVDLGDVAAVAAQVLTEAGHEGATYELVGTTPLSQIEVAQQIGVWLGRPVRAVAEPVEEWDARAKSTGMGDYQRDTLVKMFRYYAQHGLAGNPRVLTSFLRRAPTTLGENLTRLFMRTRA
jgi:NAD(P)H dehydrogenase (quinone)